MLTLPRINILGVGINAINLQQAVAEIDRWIVSGERHYVNVCVVHTIMECQKDEALRKIVNASGLATPDGMPLVWLGRAHGYGETDRVYGPDVMLACCDRFRAAGRRHFFYGGAPGVADRLAARLNERFPGLVVAGTYSPPFRPANTDEDPPIIEAINAARPDIVWVGLGTPKQDFWVARHRAKLNAAALVAVGAAFDFHAGVLRQAPRWMQRSGLEWVFRLSQEPRRLAYRYLVYNPAFAVCVALQLAGLRRYDVVPSRPNP